MKELHKNTLAKVVALLLTIFLGAGCLAGGVSVFYMVDQGYYDSGVESYYNTSAYYFNSMEFAHEVFRYWQMEEERIVSGHDEHMWEKFYSRQSVNAAFTITALGNPKVVLARNFDPEPGYHEYSIQIENVVITTYTCDPITVKDRFYNTYQVFQKLYFRRFQIIGWVVAGIVLLCVSVIFLIAGAGRRKDCDGVVLNLQDRIALDIYLAAAGIAIFILFQFVYETLNYRSSQIIEWVSSGVAALAAVCVMVATLLTLATRFKAGCWWENTFILRILKLAAKVLRALGSAACEIITAVPVHWKVSLSFLGVTVLNLILLYHSFVNYNSFALFLFSVINLVLFFVTAFAAMNMRRIKEAGKRLAAGDLESKINTRRMYLDFLDHANNLNSIGDGMAVAVSQRMKSERLKTELITNISHDIKTPLTSIVNYVDLLSKEKLAGDAVEYVEVLQRHTARLKKLTEDLVEASKASTGNISVALIRTDLRELANQSIGEYQERFLAVGLETVVTMPENEVFAIADGKLLWRVLDNLLNNAYKYSQPNTRVYIDVLRTGGEAGIVIKNISRYRLNVDSDELMERFVRGDSTRSSDGSGLGLNIARSLVELMHGRFALSIDGDLFKTEIWLGQHMA